MNGSWIWDAYHQYAPNTFAVLRKRFFLKSGKGIRAAAICGACSGEYRLYVNGRRLFRGGAPCSEGCQYVDRYALTAEDLQALAEGENAVAALCYQYGKGLQCRPSARAGFIFSMEIEYDDGEKDAVVSDGTWKIAFPACWDTSSPQMFYALGFQEIADVGRFRKEMLAREYDDGVWSDMDEPGNNTDPSSFARENWEYAVAASDYEAALLPRAIPFLRETDRDFGAPAEYGECHTDFNAMARCNIADMLSDEAHGPLEGYSLETSHEGIRITCRDAEKPGAVYLVFDTGTEIVGYPKLELEAGSDAVVDIGYSECLDGRGRVNAARQGIRQADRLIVPPGRHCWQVFHRRAFRYVQLTVRGKDVRVVIERLGAAVLEYPYEKEAYFSSGDRALNGIYETSKATLKACMKEVYEDCPLREHAQYTGDLRVQALMNYYTFNDFKLAREGLRQFAREQRPDGWFKTLSPGCTRHNIVDYLPIWIFALWDYYMFSGDASLLAELYGSVRKLVGWLVSNAGEDGLIPRKSDFWIFIDWSDFPKRGTVAAFQCAYYRGLVLAGKIARAMGDREYAGYCVRQAQKVRSAINDRFWNEERGLYCDCIDENGAKKGFGFQTNCFAVLFGVAGAGRSARIRGAISALGYKITTGYFKFYELEMLWGMRDYGAFFRAFSYWESMLERGAVTWWETFDADADEIPEASLCHAWGAAPLYHIPSKIVGVTPLAPGFERMLIRPRMSGLKQCRALIPTVRGDVEFRYELRGAEETIEIAIPENTRAVYLRDGSGKEKARVHALAAGKNTFRFTV